MPTIKIYEEETEWYINHSNNQITYKAQKYIDNII